MMHWLASAISHLGYAGILALMFLENIVLPLPSELIMPLWRGPATCWVGTAGRSRAG